MRRKIAMILSDNIRRELATHHMEPAELEQKTGLQAGTIYGILDGKVTNIEIDEICRLSKGLNCDFLSLLHEHRKGIKEV